MFVEVVDPSGRPLGPQERYGCSRLRLSRVRLDASLPRATFQEEEQRAPRGTVSHAHLSEIAAGLSEACKLFSLALGMQAALVECDVVVEPQNGRSRLLADGSAHGFGEIRLAIGTGAPGLDVRHIARHEALHLLLAKAMPRDQHVRWDAKDDTFVDCIVRGIESCDEPESAPELPERLLETPPRARGWKQWAEAEQRSAPAFFEQLDARVTAWVAELHEPEGEARDAFAAHKRTWAIETAFGRRWLREARREAQSDDAPIDWLIDDRRHHFHLYASGGIARYRPAASLAALSDDALDWTVKLSLLAQALQCADDRTFDAALCGEADAVGEGEQACRHKVLEATAAAPRKDRARLYLARRGSACRAPPPGRELLHRSPPRGREVVQRALFGLPPAAEARVVWARIAARLLTDHAGEISALSVGPPPPRGRVVVIAEDAACAEPWLQARALLGQAFAERRVADWVPRIDLVQSLSQVGKSAEPALLVFGCALQASFSSLLTSVRALAARSNVRGALFRSLEAGAAHQRTPSCTPPRDPRYREAIWAPPERAQSGDDLVHAIDEETRGGQLLTPLSHLLSITSFGVEEVILEPDAPARPRARA